MSIFGTDGVRGKGSERSFSKPVDALKIDGIFSKNLCAEIACQAIRVSMAKNVIIGWDRRPYNPLIADYVVKEITGYAQNIHVLGEISTPALQFEMMYSGSDLGIMITASHNKSSDTGVKILFENGRKPTVQEEREIESSIFSNLYPPKTKSVITSSNAYNYIQWVEENLLSNAIDFFPKTELIIDGAGGWISEWLWEILSKNDVNCKEVGDRDLDINLNSGAGSLKEGELSWEYCRSSSHRLLNTLTPSPRGSILGASFDGDGDRCFLICSTGDAVLVMGGDWFLRLLAPKLKNYRDFLIAITIESSLDVQRAINGLPNGTIVETSVGDRWLQHTLMEHDHELKVGAEPSGHVVLPQSFKPGIGHWGDGISTMIRFLEIINSYGPNWMDKIPPMSGFSLTRSVSPSNRRLWDPRGKIGSSAVTCVSDFFNFSDTMSDQMEIKRYEDLLTINIENGDLWTVNIRNSGTEPITRITVKSSGNDEERGRMLGESILNRLSPLLTANSK